MEEQVVCAYSGAKVSKAEAKQGFTIRPSIMALIQKKIPGFNRDSWILIKYLKEFKLKYVQSMTTGDNSKKMQLSSYVAEAVAKHDFLSVNYLDTVGETVGEKSSTYEHMIDKIAEFGGSMGFVAIFFIFIIAWIILNSIVLPNGGFDKYPYILLNLFLGIVAAIQAPFIMMSQNRSQSADRKRALNDYKVSLKIEFELSILREKIDFVINEQNTHILDLIQLQTETIEELRREELIREQNK